MNPMRITIATRQARELLRTPKSQMPAKTLKSIAADLVEFVEDAGRELQGAPPRALTGQAVVEDDRLLTEVAHYLADEDRRTERREAGLFTADDLLDADFLAEHQAFRLADLDDEEMWSEEALAEYGLQRIPEDLNEGREPLFSAGLEDHKAAMRHFYPSLAV